jgi:mannosyl-3-phosphoglycerate phosphatase
MTSSINTCIVLTDLDGTLIDHDDYSWDAASEALNELKSRKTPIIPCTSKTRSEIELMREKLGLKDPFISENGGGIFIPEAYFDFDFEYTRKEGEYLIIEQGTPYSELRSALDGIRKKLGFEIIGFGDMSAEEVAGDTGLDIESAKLAKEREYDEAFIFEGNEEDEKTLKHEITARRLNWTKGGRYWHIMGDNDKGLAVSRLVDIFQKRCSVKSVGLGDSLNDLPMLKAVDIPFLVEKKGGGWDPKVDFVGLRRVNGAGPVGWNTAIHEYLLTL